VDTVYLKNVCGNSGLPTWTMFDTDMKMNYQNDNWALWHATNNQTTFPSFSNENYFASKEHFRTDFSFRGLNANNNNNFLKRIPMSQFLFGQDSPFFNQIIGKNFWQKTDSKMIDDKFELSLNRKIRIHSNNTSHFRGKFDKVSDELFCF